MKYIFTTLSVFFISGCSSFYAYTIIEPNEKNEWVVEDHLAKYQCDDFLVTSRPIGVKINYATIGPFGIAIIPVTRPYEDTMPKVAILNDYNLPQKLKYPNNLHITIVVLDSNHWDFTSDPLVHIQHDSKNYKPIQKIPIHHSATYIYAFDLHPNNVKAFTLKFDKPFERCRISDLHYKKVVEHAFDFNIL